MTLTGSRIGQFRIDAQIGQGGMGRVYRGFDENLKRPVAIKVLRAKSRGSARARARFIREARVLSRLRHPSICQIYDLIEHEDTDLLVLELVEGRTLSRESLAALPPERRLRLARDLADVLVTAHRAGVVHRDLKPDNLMLTLEGELKVLDFGIARPFEESQDPGAEISVRPTAERLPVPASVSDEADLGPTLAHPFSLLEDATTTETFELDPAVTFYTDDRSLVGTLGYMSPEQAQNLPPSPASDMFSFGVLLQEMATGRKAYPETSSIHERFRNVLEGRLHPLDGVEADLASLIRALTDPSASQRPSASLARDRLERILAKPELLRRRRQRRAITAAAFLLFSSLVGLLLRSRFQAQQSAAVATEFALQARDVEWLMRASALAPPRDLRPLRREVRRRMGALEAQMEDLGAVARGPGLHALGRSSLALGDVEGARRYLEAARETRYPARGLDGDLGRTLLRLYQDRLTGLRLRLPPEEQQAPLEELHRELRDPGLELLHRGRSGSGGLVERETDALDKVRIALYEERWDDAVVAADRAAEDHPRLYEALLLQGRTHMNRGFEQLPRGDYAGLAEGIRRSRDAWRRAIHVGRGDPAGYLGLCELAELEIRLFLHGTGGDTGPVIEQGLEACEKAAAIDPEDAEIAGFAAVLRFRAAEGAPEADLYTAAATHARAALELDPNLVWVWNTLGNVYTAWADHRVYRLDEDPTPQIEQGEAAFRAALERAPASARPWNGIGNLYALKSWYDVAHGRDPRAALAASAEAYTAALERQPTADFIYANLVGNLVQQVDYAVVGLGTDPAVPLLRGYEVAERCLELNPKAAGCLAGRGALKRLEARRRHREDGDDPADLLTDALDDLERALTVHPDNPYYLLAAVQARLARARTAPEIDVAGDLSTARRLLVNIRELDPGLSEIRPIEEELASLERTGRAQNP